MFRFWISIYIILFPFSLLQEKPYLEITFCKFKLSNNIKRGNITFYIIYTFKIDERGHPVDIEKVVDNYVGIDEVSLCIEKWKFHGIKKDTKVVTIFFWKHSEGWKELNVSSKYFNQKIKISGEPCPYLK